MNKAVKICRIAAAVITVSVVAVLSLMVYANHTLSDSYSVIKGKNLSVNCRVPITVEYDKKEAKDRENYNVNFKMFGIFPVSNADVEVVDNMTVDVLGRPFGIKIYTDGVLVVKISDVETNSGNKNPAVESGIKIGDYILSIDGEKVYSNDDVAKIIEDSGGQALKVELLRSNKNKTVTLTPALAKDGVYRIGVWVRDSTAGIGTLTFYSPAADTVCGLGHGIYDEDTETLMSVASGELKEAEIVSVERGTAGSPGELKGRLLSKTIGKILLNSKIGIFGTSETTYENTIRKSVAPKQEVKDGKAYIYCTVDSGKPRMYTCEIKLYAHENHEHSFIVTVTDSRLINLTGGIVQGMSGSPLIQNGKLIGAITHVLVDDPTTGYAIFAENMLETAQSLSNSGKLRDAS